MIAHATTHTTDIQMFKGYRGNVHPAQIREHLDARIPAREAGLLLRTDGLSLTLSAAAVSRQTR